MSISPQLRRLRFSLRTLFVVVTVVCVWLGWQVPIVRDRHGLLRWVRDFEGPVLTAGPEDDESLELPFFRRLIGDRAVTFIGFPSDVVSMEEIRRIERAFPEAEVVVPGTIAPIPKKWRRADGVKRYSNWRNNSRANP